MQESLGLTPVDALLLLFCCCIFEINLKKIIHSFIHGTAAIRLQREAAASIERIYKIFLPSKYLSPLKDLKEVRFFLLESENIEVSSRG